MRSKIFTLLLVSMIGLASCRKDKVELNIKQYDDQQIQNYIAANGLTGMTRDTSGGDTTGMYYKLLLPGVVVPPATSLVPFQYSDKVSYVFTARSLDGGYVVSDTIINHFEDYVGHLSNDAGTVPNGVGLQSAVHNILKYPGASMRLIIPSHLAYGVNGYRNISGTTAKINGNQSLDCYIHAIANYSTYDDQVIQNYIKANNLTGYTKKESTNLPGNYYYYKIFQQGTSTDRIGVNSIISVYYVAYLLNGTTYQDASQALTTFEVSGLTFAAQEALINFGAPGNIISVLVPSKLAYGDTPPTTLATNSCLNFTFNVQTVTQQ